MSEAQSEVAREIGRRVKERREKKGWTQFELAAKTFELAAKANGGITPVTISRVENGVHFPKPETLDQIAKALGVSLKDDLMGMTTQDVTKAKPARKNKKGTTKSYTRQTSLAA